MTALLIDLDGVLYEGERPIDGAAVAAAGWLSRHAPGPAAPFVAALPKRFADLLAA